MTTARGTGDGDTRYARERGFHDAKYTDVGESQTEKYYAVLASCYTRYKQALEAGAGGRDVLEYGCGKGSSAYDLAARGDRVTGIDISPVAITSAAKVAADRGLDVSFVEMNAERLEFPAESFDLICGASILHHLDLDTSSAQVARCLRPEARGVFVEPLGHNPLINLYRRRTPQLRTPDEHPLRMPDFDVFRRYFGSVDFDFFGLATLAAYPFRSRAAFTTVLRRLETVDQVAFERVPWLRRFAWFCVVELRQPRPALG